MMKKPHIAFFANGTKSHVNSILAVSAVLKQRGYRVSCAAESSFVADFQKIGVETVAYQFFDSSAQFEQMTLLALEPEDPRNLEVTMDLYGPIYIANSITVLEQVAKYFEENKPDLIIYDPDALAGRMFAASYGIPSIQISPYFSFYNAFYTQENCGWCNPAPSEELCRRLDAYYSMVFPPAKLNLYLIPRQFQINERTFTEGFAFVGPCVQRHDNDPAIEEKYAGKKVILVSRSASASELSVDIAYFRSFIDALSNSPWHVILSTGDKLDTSMLGPLPSNIEINRSIPQYKLIPYASLFIGSGGTVSTFEALYHGVPCILIPQDGFHAEFGYRIKQLGLGRILSKTQTDAESIRTAIQQAMSDNILRDKVKAMQRSIRETGGQEIAADVIERFLNENPFAPPH